MKHLSKRSWLLIVLVLVIVGYFAWDSFSQPNIKDLEGGFEEVAFVRNDNNKGGIVRIYAITVGNPTVAQYDACVALLPINEYGSVTKVYFFDKSRPYPKELSLSEPHYDGSKYEAIRVIRNRGVKEN